MVLMDKFDSLSEDNRIKNILYILENEYYSLAITLTSGDVLLGDQTTDFEMQYLPYSEKYRDRDDYEFLKMFEKPISNHIVLLFPDGQGMVYGHAYAVRTCSIGYQLLDFCEQICQSRHAKIIRINITNVLKKANF
jgi:hypothetical protein